MQGSRFGDYADLVFRDEGLRVCQRVWMGFEGFALRLLRVRFRCLALGLYGPSKNMEALETWPNYVSKFGPKVLSLWQSGGSVGPNSCGCSKDFKIHLPTDCSRNR